jgi:putative endonuclease
MLPSASVYFLTNKHHSTLYIGLSTNLSTRLWEHRTKQNKKSFSARYNLYKLVYIEPFETVVEAIKREKYLKGKSRAFKEALICRTNPYWNDLQLDALTREPRS